MKAFTKYNDFVGTSAADFEDREATLATFFQEKGGDITRFEPIGMGFYLTPKDSVGIKFFCIDTTKSQPDEPHIVQIDGNGTIPFKEYFRIFKGLSIVMVQEFYKDYEVIESMSL